MGNNIYKFLVNKTMDMMDNDKKDEEMMGLMEKKEEE